MPQPLRARPRGFPIRARRLPQVRCRSLNSESLNVPSSNSPWALSRARASLWVAALALAASPVPALAQANCPTPLSLAAHHDCASGKLQLTWDPAAGYLEIAVSIDGVEVATGLPGGTTQYHHAQPAPGRRTYTVTATCASGTPRSASVAVWIAAPAAELILGLEGLDSGGALGAIDSAEELHAALGRLGRTATVLQASFLTYPCLPELLQAAERVWVMGGTWPNDYRLGLAEATALANYAAQGKGIYLEAADHWAFNHVLSPLDARDGVETQSVADGTNELTAMIGLAAPAFGIAEAWANPVTYLEDRPGLNDYNDQLVVTGTNPGWPVDPVLDVAVLWRNHDDDGGTEGDFPVTIAARHQDGGIMVSSSWEFGGFGADRTQLATRLLEAFGVTVVPPEAFVRGNCTGPADASVNIADAIYLLGFLFPVDLDADGVPDPSPLACADACDANDDGVLNLADVVRLLGALFGAPATPLSAPGPTCGTDPTPDPLSCPAQQLCP